MESLYAMQRANGDWFAFDDVGRLRVPVFRSSGEAMRARERNNGMQLFKPVALNERALTELAPENGRDAATTCFWLVEDHSPVNLSRGARSLEHAELAALVRTGEAGPPAMNRGEGAR